MNVKSTLSGLGTVLVGCALLAVVPLCGLVFLSAESV
jgi:hypothetical protein